MAGHNKVHNLEKQKEGFHSVLTSLEGQRRLEESGGEGDEAELPEQHNSGGGSMR